MISDWGKGVRVEFEGLWWSDFEIYDRVLRIISRKI